MFNKLYKMFRNNVPPKKNVSHLQIFWIYLLTLKHKNLKVLKKFRYLHIDNLIYLKIYKQIMNTIMVCLKKVFYFNLNFSCNFKVQKHINCDVTVTSRLRKISGRNGSKQKQTPMKLNMATGQKPKCHYQCFK